MDFVFTLAGAAVVAVGLREIFHTLFHPWARGGLSKTVFHAAWVASRTMGHRYGSGVGPAVMVAVIVAWVALQVVGWALIYHPHVPEAFTYAEGAGAGTGAAPDAVEALYISLMALGTLGYGDVVATGGWLRLIAPLEALIGLAVLTAALTWFTQVYPPLLRRRALALELKELADVRYAELIGELDDVSVSRTLDGVTASLGQVHSDFAHHAEGFYFREPDPEISLSRQLSHALTLRDAALGSDRPTVRMSGRRLAAGLAALARRLDVDFLHVGGTVEEIVAAYAVEHGHGIAGAAGGATPSG